MGPRLDWWRLPVAMLILAAALVTLTPEPADAAPAAPAAPTFVCPPGTTPQTCAVAQTLEVTLRGLAAAGVPVPSLLTELIDGLDNGIGPSDWASDVVAACTAIDCGLVLQEVYDLALWAAQAAKEAYKFDLLQAEKEAEKAAQTELERYCALFPESERCTAYQVPTGGNAFSAFPGGAHYSGPVTTEWTYLGVDAARAVDRTWVLAWEPTYPDASSLQSSESVVTWQHPTDSTSWVQIQAKTSGRYPDPPGSVQFRIGFRAGAATCGAAGGCWTGYTPAQPLTGWGDGGAVVGIRVTGTTGGCTSTCNVGLALVVPGGTVTATINWARVEYIGRPGYYTTGLGKSELGAGGFIQDYVSMPQSTLVEKIGLFDPLAPVPTTEEAPYPNESPFTNPDDPPPTPTEEELPGTVTDPTLPTRPTEVPNTTIPSPANDIEEQTNRQAGFFDNLMSAIGTGFNWLGGVINSGFSWLYNGIKGLFLWLGDLLDTLLRWIGALLETIIEWLRRIRDAIVSLGDLMSYLLELIVGGLRDLGTLLMGGLRAILDAVNSLLGVILDLPGLIWEAFLNGLQLLFVPEALPQVQECGATFPCNWATEVGQVFGSMGGLIASGSCTTPTVGWSGGFTASFPPPPGCSGGNSGAAGANDSTAGDLFGYRTLIRTIFAVALWLGFIRKVLSMAPWSRDGEMPLSEGVTITA